MRNDTDGNRIRVTVTVTEDDSIEQLVDCVEDVVDARIVDAPGSSRRPTTLRIDVRDVTPKQWEALEVAVEQGYFDCPRETDLETLAATLSISKSAVSQRLRAAESTLLRAIVEATRASGPHDVDTGAEPEPETR
ncbi:helix-turn-helix domain-containing protein [Haloterrigena sp. SYSU A558-1]|uniref:Helix-turn-helix domain-containing protein n=1 Tax=Haloterrigena gelatinilytica TaxID=2741724 RepID=A0A8J8GN61_9EURY|nr:helix-turn-helix domain-containing protein [Haloterrigena gelatinilytica]NUB92220.1 helix-turn-helix domain-containing protein [Haloterrigena gelatinilytica]NUC71950.1 helix-turn-helix domain-containing protein [Haloterrigena gelatinilytica]